MKDNYSIITNFGCHWACKYCITKQLDIPKTIISQADETLASIDNIDFLSISGGGDPLYNLDIERIKWFEDLHNYCKDNSIEFELHTSIIKDTYEMFYDLFDRVVYHYTKQHDAIYKFSKMKMKAQKRLVFVECEFQDWHRNFNGGGHAQEKIHKFIFDDMLNMEVSIRQTINSKGIAALQYCETKEYCDKYGWHYITQDDYNKYIVNDKIYTKFMNIGKNN